MSSPQRKMVRPSWTSAFARPASAGSAAADASSKLSDAAALENLHIRRNELTEVFCPEKPQVECVRCLQLSWAC